MLLVQEMEAVQREVVAQADARAEKAESEAAAEKEQRKRIMEAAANGALPLAASSPGGGTYKAGMHVNVPTPRPRIVKGQRCDHRW